MEKDRVMRLQNWIESHKIDATFLHKRVVEINEEKFLLVEPKGEKLLAQDMSVVLNDEDLDLMGQFPIDGLIFEIADKFYYSREGKDLIDSESTTLENNLVFELFVKDFHELLYIGNTTEALVFPHLGVHGSYDLCNASGHYKDYCKKAKWLNITTLGLCEENTLAGTLLFQAACKKEGINSVIGETIAIQHNNLLQYHIKLYVVDFDGWQNLLRINAKLNTSQTRSITIEQLEGLQAGLICVLTPTIDLPEVYNIKTRKIFDQFEKLFYQLDFVEWSNKVKEDEWLMYLQNYMVGFVKNDPYCKNIEPLALYDSFYIEQHNANVQPVLWRIGKRSSFKYRSKDRYFKTASEYYDQASELFTTEAGEDLLMLGIENTLMFEDINFTIPTGEKHLPDYELTEAESQEFESSEDLFWHLINVGLEEKVIAKGLDLDVYLERIQEEVRVIELGHVRDYFLIVWDILNFCKTQGIITGIGRGSAAGCLVSYLLGIVQIDPIEYGLLFERFLNEGRVGKSLPDIDNDIQGNRRQEVKDYIEQRYGKDYVAGIGTYGTFKIRAAMKDLIREIGGDAKEANYISAAIDAEDKFVNLFEHSLKLGSNPRIYNFIKKHSYQLNHIPAIFQQPKTQSIHAAGIIIVPKHQGPIYQQLPVKSMNEGTVVTEWEGTEIEEAGFLKVDVLGLKQLDKFDEIFKSIENLRGFKMGLDNIPLDDRKVYTYFQNGWNEDVFQFGGGGLKGYCKTLLPDNIEDLIATVALYRPGPIETGAHEDYAAIKNGGKEPQYYYGLEDITKSTHSKIVYQEQIMMIVQQLGGFSLVEADDIRKAMGKKIPEVMAKYKVKFIEGAVNNGCPQEEAESLWTDMERFAGYAFNRSHAACYAITGYYSQWLKCNYAIEFWLTSLKHSDDKDLQARIAEIKAIGSDINITGPSINISTTEYIGELSNNTIYWSLSSIKHVGINAVLNLVRIREEKGTFFDFNSFLQVVAEDKEIRKSKLQEGERLLSPINRRVICNLIISGAFDEVERLFMPNQRKALLERYFQILHPELKLGVEYNDKQWKDRTGAYYDLLQSCENFKWILEQRKLCGFGTIDFNDLLRDIDFDKKGIYRSNLDILQLSLQDRTEITISAGVVETVTIRSSTKGNFAQILLHDGYAELIVMIWPEVYEKYEQEINDSKGKLLFMNGEVTYDARYKKQNLMNSKSWSQVIFL